MDSRDIEKVAEHCDRVLDLKNAELSDEYFYQSLPLCVIDAVWSIGVLYDGVRNVVTRYCSYFRLPRLRKNRNKLPLIKEQESISGFLKKKKKFGIEKFTNNIFDNKQRTSSRNGILKSEAVFQFSEVLKSYNVDYFQDVTNIVSSMDFEREIGLIPGQSSGISLKMFFMLAGDDNLIKPDRWIKRFLQSVLKYDICDVDVQSILASATKILKIKYPNLTPRLLDHEIWKHQR